MVNEIPPPPSPSTSRPSSPLPGKENTDSNLAVTSANNVGVEPGNLSNDIAASLPVYKTDGTGSNNGEPTSTEKSDSQTLINSCCEEKRSISETDFPFENTLSCLTTLLKNLPSNKEERENRLFSYAKEMCKDRFDPVITNLLSAMGTESSEFKDAFNKFLLENKAKMIEQLSVTTFHSLEEFIDNEYIHNPKTPLLPCDEFQQLAAYNKLVRELDSNIEEINVILVKNQKSDSESDSDF